MNKGGSLLDQLYDPNEFKKIGEELIELLTKYLDDSVHDKLPVNNYISPDESLDTWQNFMAKPATLIEYFQKVLDTSIHVHNPNYMGHQVSAPAPLAAFGGLVSDLLNNGMAVYEMGGASNPLEKMATDMLCRKIGYDENAAGFMTSGGTLANLTALLTARSIKVDDDVWEVGNKGNLGIMVSEQAHYCIDRAARIMGLGAEGIVKLPVNDKFQVKVEELEERFLMAKEKGIQVFAIVASSCSTSTGSYDDIEAFATFAKKHNLWLHVDGAHGGAVVMSEKYKHLVKGIAEADSVIIDCHKMMMTPTICTAVLYRSRSSSSQTFRQKADYLFDESEDFDWFNSGKRTFECTKLMMSLKFMAIVRHVGIEVFEELVDRLYDRARQFAQMIEKDENFELGITPEANILCFRYIGENINHVNSKIRQHLLEEGKFYIVQTRLNGEIYLRTSIMNPMTTSKNFQLLMAEINMIAKSV
jgi:L-2,4-diaminobutyrate decarboxylase